jgi:putative peptidoglycan lipid II flippase
MIRKFLNIETKNITLAALIFSASSLISKILGLIRDRLLAGEFGAGSELDVYFEAFRIPDCVYNILIAGGVVVAFMPLFSEYFLKNKQEAWKFVNNVLNIFLFSWYRLALVPFYSCHYEDNSSRFFSGAN